MMGCATGITGKGLKICRGKPSTPVGFLLSVVVHIEKKPVELELLCSVSFHLW